MRINKKEIKEPISHIVKISNKILDIIGGHSFIYEVSRNRKYGFDEDFFLIQLKYRK